MSDPFTDYDMSLHEIAERLYVSGERRAYDQFMVYITAIDVLRAELEATRTIAVQRSADLQYLKQHLRLIILTNQSTPAFARLDRVMDTLNDIP